MCMPARACLCAVHFVHACTCLSRSVEVLPIDYNEMKRVALS